jgi:hypothetical protein
MITPKEKAKELVDKIYFNIDYDLAGMPNTKRMVAKECALIAVDEILKNPTPKQRKHFEKVKEEINKL